MDITVRIDGIGSGNTSRLAGRLAARLASRRRLPPRRDVAPEAALPETQPHRHPGAGRDPDAPPQPSTADL